MDLHLIARTRLDLGRLGVSTNDSDFDSDADASDGGTSQVAASRLSKEEENLVQVYLYHKPPLHVRRTLDQYYYYMLEDTRERDADQVVTRWAKDQLFKSHHNILMVDQLWIWVIKGTEDQPDRIISCFPEREGQDSGSLDDLLRNVLHQNKDKRQPITTAAGLAARIVTTCSDVFSWSQEAELVRFLHFFEATVGRVGDDEIRLLNDFSKSSERLHRLKDKHFEYAKDKDEMLIKILDVRPQIKLLTEAKDIRDEINIILHVLGKQRGVLEDDIITSFFESKTNDKTDPDVSNAWKEPLRIIKRAIGDFEKMERQMKDIVDDLNHLLDLQQKQATVWEARSTREGARETSKQGSVHGHLHHGDHHLLASILLCLLLRPQHCRIPHRRQRTDQLASTSFERLPVRHLIRCHPPLHRTRFRHRDRLCRLPSLQQQLADSLHHQISQHLVVAPFHANSLL